MWAAWPEVAAAPPILGDAAAITLRYAERVAAGKGFTYNDHERVLGAVRADQVDELRLRNHLLIRAWREHREDSAVQRAP